MDLNNLKCFRTIVYLPNWSKHEQRDRLRALWRLQCWEADWHHHSWISSRLASQVLRQTMVQAYQLQHNLVEQRRTQRRHITYHHCQLEQIKLVPCLPYARCSIKTFFPLFPFILSLLILSHFWLRLSQNHNNDIDIHCCRKFVFDVLCFLLVWKSLFELCCKNWKEFREIGSTCYL